MEHEFVISDAKQPAGQRPHVSIDPFDHDHLQAVGLRMISCHDRIDGLIGTPIAQ